jgi:DNA-binding transcriptional ArsR family regulator
VTADRESAGRQGRSEPDDVLDVLVALADPTRRRILEVLAVHGGGTASTLATELPVSRQAVVKHLAVLDRAGLVAGRRSGREVRYLLCPRRLDATAQWLAGLATEWDRRLDTIKRIAESSDTDESHPAGVPLVSDPVVAVDQVRS